MLEAQSLWGWNSHHPPTCKASDFLSLLHLNATLISLCQEVNLQFGQISKPANLVLL